MIKQLRFDLKLLRKRRIQFAFLIIISTVYVLSSFYWRYIKEEVIAMGAIYQSIIVCALICDALNHHLQKEHSVINYKSLVYFPTTRERYYASKGIIILGLCIFESILTWLNLFIVKFVIGYSMSASYGWYLCYLITITLLIESILYFGASLSAWIMQNVLVAIAGLCGMIVALGVMKDNISFLLFGTFRQGLTLGIILCVWLIGLCLITLISKKIK